MSTRDSEATLPELLSTVRAHVYAVGGQPFEASRAEKAAACQVADGYTPADVLSCYLQVWARPEIRPYRWAEKVDAKLRDMARRRRAREAGR